MDLDVFSQANRLRCESPDGFGKPVGHWSLSDWFTAAMGELGEAANVAKKLNRIRDGIPGNGDVTEYELRQCLADEIADTVIYLDLLAQSEGLLLSTIVANKFDRTSAKIGYEPLIPAPFETAHPDDRAVDQFAIRMKAKLAQARADGRGGWDDPARCSVEKLVKLMLNHVHRGDPVDIANFCMMLSLRGVTGNDGPVARQYFDRVNALAEQIIDGRVQEARAAERERLVRLAENADGAVITWTDVDPDGLGGGNAGQIQQPLADWLRNQNE